MTGSEIIALEPGQELESLVHSVIGGSENGPVLPWSRRSGLFLRLCLESYVAGFGWPVVVRLAEGYGCWLQDPTMKGVRHEEAGILAFYTNILYLNEKISPGFATTPSHAACLAVALAGAKS